MKSEEGAAGTVAERRVQLRLFSPPKPLLERFGQDFFRRIPRSPGVYLMGGRAEGLLYVGQSRNLRARLNSYKNLNPERASRKLVRLVHEVTSITWEVCGSPEQAQLRENELLRLHKPRFNVANTRPEHYGFLGVQAQGRGLVLRRTTAQKPEAAEALYGAFKGIGRVRGAHGALLRLLWAIARQPASPYEIPSVLLHGRPPNRFALELSPGTAEGVSDALAAFLGGESERFLDLVAASLPSSHGVCPFLAKLWERDLESLREFYRLGPQRNRELRRRFGVGEGVIEQAELDNLTVIWRQDVGVLARGASQQANIASGQWYSPSARSTSSHRAPNAPR